MMGSHPYVCHMFALCRHIPTMIIPAQISAIHGASGTFQEPIIHCKAARRKPPVIYCHDSQEHDMLLFGLPQKTASGPQIQFATYLSVPPS